MVQINSDTQKMIQNRLERIRIASRELRQAPLSVKNKVLERLIRALDENSMAILKENLDDLNRLPADTSAAFRDRLKLTHDRLKGMQASLRDVILFADPIGEVVEDKTLRNGLHLKRVRAPLGVILMIFEARPNVITEAFSLALKSGNAIILRGGSDSLRSATVLYRFISEALKAEGLPADVFWGITETDRSWVQYLIQQNKFIDVVVPRGGEGLIQMVTKNSTIPIIKNDQGLCHVYVHEDAAQPMALAIVENAKTQRPGVCNAMETVLVHEKIKDSFIPALYDRLSSHQVEWYVCPKTLGVLSGRKNVQSAEDANWDTEYLDLKMNCRVVASLEEAISHIELHGSQHSESIITSSEKIARKFQESVDAAAVYWNASTRFTDGFEFGLGGELGISTQKLHVRGPVGLREMTNTRWVIDGKGQIR